MPFLLKCFFIRKITCVAFFFFFFFFQYNFRFTCRYSNILHLYRKLFASKYNFHNYSHSFYVVHSKKMLSNRFVPKFFSFGIPGSFFFFWGTLFKKKLYLKNFNIKNKDNKVKAPVFDLLNPSPASGIVIKFTFLTQNHNNSSNSKLNLQMIFSEEKIRWIYRWYFPKKKLIAISYGWVVAELKFKYWSLPV